MISISIALVIIATEAAWLINKYLDQKSTLNTTADNSALLEASEEQFKKFDSRINKAFENHQLIRTELDSLKLSIGLKGNR